MTIRPSRSADVTRLIEDLRSDDALRRESAGARLAVIGSRATARLIALAADTAAGTDARAAAFRALAATGARAALPAALARARRTGRCAGRRGHRATAPVVQTSSRDATRAFDRLTALALSAEAPVERRLAAIAALEGLPDRLMRPVYEMLAPRQFVARRRPARAATGRRGPLARGRRGARTARRSRRRRRRWCARTARRHA